MRNPKRHWPWITILLIFLPAIGLAQNTSDIRVLEQGKPIERELAGAEVHAYSIQLTAGQFLKVIVDQRGIDVVVTAFGPDGRRVARVDGASGAQGPEQLLLVAETSGTHRLELRSVEEMATGGRYVGRYEVKIETLRTTIPEDKKLLEIFDLNNRASEQAFNAYVHQVNGNYVEALDAYQKSIPLSEATGNREQLVFTWNSMGRIYFLQGNYARALEYYQKSLIASEESGNKTQSANTLNNLSLVYRNTGDFGKALDSAQRGLAMLESLGRKSGVANAEMNIGLAYGSMGDYGRAVEHWRKSLSLSEELGAKGLIANALDKIASAFNVQGNYDQALEYAQRSLSLNEEIKAQRQIIFSTLTIGNIHQSRADYAKALEYFQKALALSEKLGDKREIVDSLLGISSAQFSQGNYQEALDGAQGATALAGQIGNRELLLFALNRAGFSYLSLNQLENARRASEQAIEMVESLRASVAGDEARASYFALARDPYELNVEVLMQLHNKRPTEGYAAAAFQVSERARARSLLETLSEAHADIRQGVDPALLTSERTLQQRLNAGAERQMRILSGKYTEEQAVRLQKEIDVLTSEYQQVEAQIRRSSPRYAALTQPVPLTVRDIQRNVLDADTALVEYALGEDRSYLWVVTPTAIKSFELPKRAEIETSVRRVVELLSDGKRWATSAQINAEYAEAADQLSRTLLPPALMSQLKVKRLVIVGDGALQYLPFGALSSPTSKVQDPGYGQPLIADYEIVSLPSASTLAVLRRETANRARPTKSVAVLADPVFEETDERVQAATAQGRQIGNRQPSAGARNVSFDQSINSQALLRALDYKSNADGSGPASGQLHITRLPFTRFEAEGILASAPKGQSLRATDFRANRETATSADLAQYRFVHFATHGILNSEHPELSGIVLSMVDERGQPANGFLRLNEIYNLNLPADLVVLSACQTGLGKEIRGEGLVGLTRGFMYAGAPRVVASLWKVDDAATAELMKRFYQGMLKDNLRPAAALRAAKVEMWKQKRWSAPFYWAAFELQGEWK
jgi:CHAT domain-containing protein/tetratricopeptide (TPR) repeat protein